MMRRAKQFRVRSKIWIESGGVPVLGEGKKRLLEAIDRLGSISKAANSIGISYRRAWSTLRMMESRLGYKLVEAKKGGEDGGGARLTGDARKLIEEYGELLTGMGQIVDRSLKQFFGERYAKMHTQKLEK